MIPIRDSKPEDAHHVRSTFIHTLKRRVGDKYPTTELVDTIELCLANGEVRVSHLDTDTEAITGWCASSGNVLIYVHVKPAFRAGRCGDHVGSMLVRDACLVSPVTCPYLTHNGAALLAALGLEVADVG